MTPEEVQRRANAAERIFNDPVMQEALGVMEKEVMEAWMACPIRDTDAREALWRMAVTTRKFRDILRGTMEAGKLAAAEIHRKQTALERAKQVFKQF